MCLWHRICWCFKWCIFVTNLIICILYSIFVDLLVVECWLIIIWLFLLFRHTEGDMIGCQLLLLLPLAAVWWWYDWVPAATVVATCCCLVLCFKKFSHFACSGWLFVHKMSIVFLKNLQFDIWLVASVFSAEVSNNNFVVLAEEKTVEPR